MPPLPVRQECKGQDGGGHLAAGFERRDYRLRRLPVPYLPLTLFFLHSLVLPTLFSTFYFWTCYLTCACLLGGMIGSYCCNSQYIVYPPPTWDRRLFCYYPLPTMPCLLLQLGDYPSVPHCHYCCWLIHTTYLPSYLAHPLHSSCILPLYTTTTCLILCLPPHLPAYLPFILPFLTTCCLPPVPPCPYLFPLPVLLPTRQFFPPVLTEIQFTAFYPNT